MLACVSIAFLILSSSFHSASAQYKVEHLSKPINTSGSETAALRVGDTVLAFASLPPSGSKGAFGIKHSVTHLYQSRIAKNGKISRPKHDRWGFCNDKDHTGNLALDPVSLDAYFTRADVETLRCDIYYAKKKKRGWEKPIRIKGSVNDKHHTATHPAVGRLADGTTVLYFVSNRPGGMGGMDIWQCTVKDGIAGDPSNLGPQVNSPSDEYTPFYDQTNGILYFSSDREGGKGGFDIYCAVGQKNTWQKAEPVCGCLNSEQNDLYFNISDYDPASGFPIGGYLSSNRKDSYFLSDSMCCNDIYRWSLDSSKIVYIVEEEPDTVAFDSTTLAAYRLQHMSFPLFLYFHNDEPNPRSRDTSTFVDYSECQSNYVQLRPTYIAHQRSSHDSLLMEEFFDSCVIGAYAQAKAMLDDIEEVLAEGHNVELTIAGYASPLFVDEYNLRLSHRRIVSFINMIRAWKEGKLNEALDNGLLRIVENPQGAIPPTDESRAADAIYSLPAASARRIEVVGCRVY